MDKNSFAKHALMIVTIHKGVNAYCREVNTLSASATNNSTLQMKPSLDKKKYEAIAPSWSPAGLVSEARPV